MGKKAISLETRYRIIAYNDLKFAQNKIAELCKVSVKCVHTTVKNKRLYGRVDEKKRSGRPRKTTKREDNKLFLMCRDQPFKSAKSLAHEWQRDGEPIASKRTVCRRLNDFKLEAHVAAAKPVHTMAHKKARLDWCRQRVNWGHSKWASIIFSDEANYELTNRKTRPIVRRFKNEKYKDRFLIKKQQGGGGSVGIWGCINIEGTGCCSTYTGRLNAERYLDILENELKPSIELLKTNENDLIFQQDNASCHTAKIVKRYFNEENIQLLPWPAVSPDLSPIEHLWAHIDRKLYETPPKTLSELEIACISCSKAILFFKRSKIYF